MTDWSPPPGTAGDITFVRVSSADVRSDDRDCPLATASKTRPGLESDPEQPRRYEELQTFTLAPLMDALDLIEHRRKSVAQVIARLRETQGTFGRRSRPPAHPALIEWTVAAVSRYLAAREAEQMARVATGADRTFPVPEKWVVRRSLGAPDRRGALYYEQTAWGRGYVSSNGSIRDLWLLSFNTAKQDRADAEKAAAAQTIAYGFPCGPAYGRRHEPLAGLPAARIRRPERVRVIDVGCGDGTTSILLSWDLEEVDHHFRQHGARALAHAADATARVAGSSCVGCKALAGCVELPRAPGLLDITAPSTPRPRRSVSASDLRAYDRCPAQYHLTRELKLKSPRPETPAILRGRAVDAWLNERHRARPARGCRTASGPTDPGRWTAGDHALHGEEAYLGAQMIAQHVPLCPLEGLDPGEQIQVQPQLSCYDPELDVVIIATPDLLHTREGGWIWREVKTATNPLWEGQSLLRGYPQLALAVLMMASGVLGGDLRRSRIELEILYPDDSGLEELDPDRPAVVDDARGVIADLAGAWSTATSYEPIPGRHCASCEVLDWCTPGREHLVPTPEPADLSH